jgi:VIT1/CCC1 family predicted Fe2+/Mn2+ transporter
VIDFMLKKIRIKLVLAHIDRVLEVLGGVIMVLTFTSVLSVSHAGKADVRAMLIGSLGCNLAWGIIDAIMYLLNSLAERTRGLDALRAMRAAKDPDEAQRMLAAEMPEQFASVLSPGELEPVLRRLRALPEPSARPQLTGDDWLGAFGIFGLVFFSTLPIVLPFLLVSRPALALRVSNLVAIALLFLTGYIFGRNTGHNPWRLGIAMVLIGCLLAGVAISLGG